MSNIKYFIWFQNLQKTGSIIDDFEISKLLALSVYMSSLTMLLKRGFHLIYRFCLDRPRSDSELCWFPVDLKGLNYMKPKIEYSLDWEGLVLFNGIPW